MTQYLEDFLGATRSMPHIVEALFELLDFADVSSLMGTSKKIRHHLLDTIDSNHKLQGILNVKFRKHCLLKGKFKRASREVTDKVDGKSFKTFGINDHIFPLKCKDKSAKANGRSIVSVCPTQYPRRFVHTIFQSQRLEEIEISEDGLEETVVERSDPGFAKLPGLALRDVTSIRPSREILLWPHHLRRVKDGKVTLALIMVAGGLRRTREVIVKLPKPLMSDGRKILRDAVLDPTQKRLLLLYDSFVVMANSKDGTVTWTYKDESLTIYNCHLFLGSKICGVTIMTPHGDIIRRVLGSGYTFLNPVSGKVLRRETLLEEGIFEGGECREICRGNYFCGIIRQGEVLESNSVSLVVAKRNAETGKIDTAKGLVFPHEFFKKCQSIETSVHKRCEALDIACGNFLVGTLNTYFTSRVDRADWRTDVLFCLDLDKFLDGDRQSCLSFPFWRAETQEGKNRLYQPWYTFDIAKEDEEAELVGVVARTCTLKAEGYRFDQSPKFKRFNHE